MKKLIPLLLTAVMAVQLTLPAFAASPVIADTNTTVSRSITQDGYVFDITERVDENYQIIRTYQRPEPASHQTASLSDELDEIRAMLVALGLDEDDVSMLPDSALQEYVGYSEVTMTTQYLKVAENGVTTPVPEAVALSESARISANRAGRAPSDIVPYSDQDYYDEDGYLRLTHGATRVSEGNDYYVFTTDALWLTMPFWRGTDTIGSCANYFAVIENTAYGMYNYEVYNVNTGAAGGTYIRNEVGDLININDDLVITGWAGAGASFILPADLHLANQARNYHVYFHFRAAISETEQEIWTNSLGSYSHMYDELQIEFPDLSIDITGDISLGGSISVSTEIDTVNTMISVNYIP